MAQLKGGSTVGGKLIADVDQLNQKLDKNSYTATDVRDKLKTVDGSGSGIDADLLDGKHASSFADATHSHSEYASSSHSHSKADVGLGNVWNYGIASKEEAEAGTSNTKYMTPLRVQNALNKFLYTIPTYYSYMAFCANVNVDSLDSAFGKGNENYIKDIGFQLGMFANFKGASIDLNQFTRGSTFSSLCSNIDELAILISDENVMNLISSSPYAKSVFINNITPLSESTFCTLVSKVVKSSTIYTDVNSLCDNMSTQMVNSLGVRILLGYCSDAIYFKFASNSTFKSRCTTLAPSYVNRFSTMEYSKWVSTGINRVFLHTVSKSTSKTDPGYNCTQKARTNIVTDGEFSISNPASNKTTPLSANVFLHTFEVFIIPNGYASTWYYDYVKFGF